MAENAQFMERAKKEVSDIEIDNLDELLSQLTQEEIDELNGDFDPDNSLLPPSERVRPQTMKDPTGPFNRKKLIKFLEKKAIEEKDWDNVKQFIKKPAGETTSVAAHPWKPKEVSKTEAEKNIDTEWDDVLQQATEEELVDLAAVLGFHGMLNQTQYYASYADEKIESGFSGVAQPEALKKVAFEPPNNTDVDASLKQIKENSSELKHLNLNNIKNISFERLEEFCEALKTNTHLDVLEMASVAMTDRVAKKLAESLKENKTLTVLNFESNFISGEVLVEIIKSINVNQTLLELRVTNQKPEVLGNKVETMITKLIEQNETLLRFGVAFEFPDARIRVQEKLQQNNDELRKKRQVKGH